MRKNVGLDERTNDNLIVSLTFDFIKNLSLACPIQILSLTNPQRFRYRILFHNNNKNKKTQSSKTKKNDEKNLMKANKKVSHTRKTQHDEKKLHESE